MTNVLKILRYIMSSVIVIVEYLNMPYLLTVVVNH